MIKQPTIFKFELGGIAFVFFLGALLHFVFEWSGNCPIVGAVASVNESVWEHFKQGFWPMCLYAAIEYRALKPLTPNFWAAKAAAVYLIPILTGTAFYAYTAIVGEEILAVDISIFALAIAVGQFVSYKIMTIPALPKSVGTAAPFFIIALAIILIVTTFYPPHLPIFIDHNTASYGIP